MANQDPKSRAQKRRDAARKVGEILHQRRREVARSLASEYAASEEDFERWFFPRSDDDGKEKN